jgi:DNA-binding NarL/FixJ family response regulator
VSQLHHDLPLQPSSNPDRILVVGADLLAEALARSLRACGFDARLAKARSSSLQLPLAFDWQPALVLLDGRSIEPEVGVELVAECRRHRVGVCVLDGRRDGHDVVDWRQAGVTALVDEGSAFAALLRTIGRLLDRADGHRGRPTELSDTRPLSAFTPEWRSSRASPRRSSGNRGDGCLTRLTERERYVLTELMEGHCAEEIAGAASVSISTVRSQIKSILQKLGVGSQLAAVALARRAGWSMERVLR